MSEHWNDVWNYCETTGFICTGHIDIVMEQLRLTARKSLCKMWCLVWIACVCVCVCVCACVCVCVSQCRALQKRLNVAQRDRDKLQQDLSSSNQSAAQLRVTKLLCHLSLSFLSCIPGFSVTKLAFKKETMPFQSGIWLWINRDTLMPGHLFGSVLMLTFFSAFCWWVTGNHSACEHIRAYENIYATCRSPKFLLQN